MIKKDAAAKLLEEHTIKCIQKFIYFDEYRNLEIFDLKPQDAHLYESFIKNILVSGNILQLIQAQIEVMDHK